MERQLRPAGVRALAVAIPSQTRTITLPSGASAMRHSLSEGMSGLDLEKAAVEQALHAAALSPGDVDLVLCASFPALPEPCIGNATPLAWEMGMERAAAWNVESACAGGLVAWRNACQEVMLGEYDTVLVVVGCPYSQTIEAGHPATDVISDAAYAMIVGPTAPGQDLVGSVIRNSGPTCPLVSWRVDLRAPSGIRLTVDGSTAGQLENWALGLLPEMARELFDKTGIAAAKVDHWVINAPTPSFVDRALEAMGAAPDGGVNINRIAGNIGPALIGVSLFYSAILREFQAGDLVLCCSVGSESSLALCLFEWPAGVALGEVPSQAPLELIAGFERERVA
jgi:3-oxoacyl-[acyl-carrier-protein] synthase III